MSAELLFLLYLDYHNITESFLERFGSKARQGRRKSFEEYMATTASRDFFISAFSWSYTPEGVDFWNPHDIFWLDVLEDYLTH